MKSTISLIILSGSFLYFFTCCGDGSSEKKTSILNEKNDFTVAQISKFEQQQCGDTLQVNTGYDLYFDFSATMLRVVTDPAIKEIITSAFHGLDVTQDKLYAIGTNSVVKEITGDKVTKQNNVMGAINYTQTMTFMTPNINQIVLNPNRPALILSDFSIDEGRPTRDADGIVSTFIREAEYASSFEAWFNSGGSIRVYGKIIKGMPVYAIVFIPNGYTNEHRMNQLIKNLDSQLSKDIKFDFHTRFVNVTQNYSGERMSDEHKMAVNGSMLPLINNMGELMVIQPDKLMSASSNKDLREKLEVSIFTGLGYTLDTTSFIQAPEFKSKISKIIRSEKNGIDLDKNAKISIFKDLKVSNSFEIGVDVNKSKQPNLYQSLQVIRYHIYASKVSSEIRFNTSLAQKTLQYDLPSGGKMIKNNCLLKSLELGMKNYASNFKFKPLYSIYTLIRQKK